MVLFCCAPYFRLQKENGQLATRRQAYKQAYKTSTQVRKCGGSPGCVTRLSKLVSKGLVLGNPSILTLATLPPRAFFRQDSLAK